MEAQLARSPESAHNRIPFPIPSSFPLHYKPPETRLLPLADSEKLKPSTLYSPLIQREAI